MADSAYIDTLGKALTTDRPDGIRPVAVVVPGGEDARAVRGDRDGELEVGGQRVVLRSRRPSRPSPIRTSAPPALTIGSIASTMPSSRLRALPDSPKFGICGSSCMSRPIPWPTERADDREARRRSTARWIACETSLRWLPGCSLLDAVEERVAVVASSSGSAGQASSPIGTVIAASATQPSWITPTSIERTSPRLQLVGAGNPVDHHRVGRGADRAREAAVALEGRAPPPASG